MRLLQFVFFFFPSIIIFGQSDIPNDMTLTLNKMHLEYLQPVEQAPTFITAGKIKYFKYNFGLELDDGKTLVLIQTKNDDKNYVPQVMTSALVSTLATNNQDVEINMMLPTNSYLIETNCDWAMEALFIPKDNIGEYQIAYLKSIYKVGIGVTNILYLAKSEVNIPPLFRYKN